MRRTILTYGIAMAGAAVALQLLQYRYTVRVFSTEIYLVIIALSFTVLGVWAGSRLTATSGKRAFQRNTQAIEYLGITERECEVLELLAEGLSNREIAKRLFVSPHTVKSHLAHLYDKFDVARRTQAIHKARALRLIP